MPVSPSSLGSLEHLERTTPITPFSDAPCLPFARARVEDRSYLLIHCLMHPWVHWRQNLLQKWADSFPKNNTETIVWIAPPKDPCENFFIQTQAGSSFGEEKNAGVMAFLAMSWMHYLQRAFLLKHEVLHVRLEHCPILKELCLIKNDLVVGIPASSRDHLKKPILTGADAESDVWKLKDPLTFYAENRFTMDAIITELQKRKDGRVCLIFLPIFQKNPHFIQLQCWLKGVDQKQFDYLFQNFCFWLLGRYEKIRGIECHTVWGRFYFDPCARRAWKQYAAEWICHGQLSLTIPNKNTYSKPQRRQPNK